MTLPRRIQKLMRCTLTPRNPGIPLVPSLWKSVGKKKLKSVSSDDGLLMDPSAESTPRQSAERSDASLLSVTSTDDESPWGRRRKPPGLLQSVCAQLFNSKVQQLPQPVPPHDAGHCVIPEESADDTLSDISNELDESNSSIAINDDGADPVFGPAGDFGLSLIDPPALPLLITLGLDISIECVPRYMNKPKSMYTFVCAQNFRRDEYAWHYRNWVYLDTCLYYYIQYRYVCIILLL